MYKKTRWKKIDSVIVGMKCFSDEIGVFIVTKVEQCIEHDRCAVNIEEKKDGIYWHTKRRVFVKTDTGLKYVVPYIWLVFHSTNMDGKMLWKIIDNVN